MSNNTPHSLDVDSITVNTVNPPFPSSDERTDYITYFLDLPSSMLNSQPFKDFSSNLNISTHQEFVSSNQDPLQQSDPALLQLLADWGVEQLYPKFLAEEISMESLKYMSKRHCEILAKDCKLNVLIKLQHKLRVWQVANASTVHSDSSDEVLIKKTCHDINVDNILKSTHEGRSILENYNSNHDLTDRMRSMLVQLIVNHFIQNGLKMNVHLADDISDQITLTFPTETKDLYFLKDRGRILGKIYAKYFNQMKALKGMGPHKSADKMKENIAPQYEEEDDIEETQIHIDEIKKGNCSWPDLEQHWTATSKLRLKSIKNSSSTEQIFKEWTHYKKPTGHRLILIDFKNKYPESETFIDLFPTFCDSLVDIFEKKLSPACADLFTELKENRTRLTEN